MSTVRSTEIITNLESIAERIAAGETIDPANLSPELAATPEAQKLLSFAKVAQAFANNLSAIPIEPVAPDRIGPWKLLRLLGSGGMGDVWLGERADGTVEHRVAIKRVRGVSMAFAQRLEAERRILAKLSHPNIARFIDAGVDTTGAPWLALDYINGETLNAWCDRAQPTLVARLQLFLAICAAVEHAHRHLVIHRDLKPANVLVDVDGKPHLLDFGIAKLLDGSGGELTAAALTPAYAAPEQLRGGEVSTATDVYALGLLLFRMLAGELPVTRHDAGLAQVLARLDEEETQRPSASAYAQAATLPYPATALRGDLDAIVSKAIRALPEARYGSVAELALDVRRYLESRPVTARAPTRRYLFARWVRRNALAVGLGAAAMIALIAGTGVALWQAERARASAQIATAEARRADAEADVARTQAQRAERGQRFLAELFASANPETNKGRMPTARDLIAQGAERLQGSTLPAADQHELALTIAESWFGIGDIDEAKKTLALANSAVDASSPRAALLAARLAMHGGDAEAAEQGFKAVLSRVVGNDERAVIERAEARTGLAQLTLWRGDAKAALSSINTVYTDLKQSFGDANPRTIEALAALGVANMGIAELDASIQQLQAAETLAQRHLGSGNAVSCRISTSLSDALERKGDFAGAHTKGLTAIESCSAVYGPAHRRYGQAELAAGYALMRLGRSSEALAYFARAREAFRSAKHFDEGSALRYAGTALLGLERYDEALVALQQAEAILSARMGADAELVLACQLNRAMALLGLGQLERAQSLAEPAWAKLEAKPPENSTRINALRVMAQLAKDRRDFASAEAHLQQLLTVQTGIHGAQSRPVALVLQRLAQFAIKRAGPGDAKQAHTWLDQALAMQKTSDAPALERLSVLLDRAALLRVTDPAASQRDVAEAKALAETVFELPPSLRQQLIR